MYIAHVCLWLYAGCGNIMKMKMVPRGGAMSDDGDDNEEEPLCGMMHQCDHDENETGHVWGPLTNLDDLFFIFYFCLIIKNIKKNSFVSI